MLDQIKHFYELLIGMTDKELKTRYKYTVLGFLWIALIPLLQMLVIGFIFTFFMKENVERYYYYLFIGLLIWNFFSVSLLKGTPCIVSDRYLISKAKFPRVVLPLSIVLSNMFHFAIGLALVAVALIPSRVLTWSTLIYLPIALLWLAVFTTGLTLLTSALNVKYRDVFFFVQAGLILWFYATPIVYPLSFIPSELQGLWNFNPLTSIVQLFHTAFLQIPPPLPETLIANAVISLVISAIGVGFFLKESKYFADWI